MAAYGSGGRESGLAQHNRDERKTLPAVGSVRCGEIYHVVGGGTPSTQIEIVLGRRYPVDQHMPTFVARLAIKVKTCHYERGCYNSTDESCAMAGSLMVVTRVGLGKVALQRSISASAQDSQALLGEWSDSSDLSIYYLTQAVHSSSAKVPR